MIYVIELMVKACVETIYLTGMIILIGLLLGLLRNNSLKNFQRRFGSRSLIVTGFIGVPVHELSHAIFALVFGHKINKIKLLQRPDENGVMGYVQHSYNQRSVYQQVGNFFIGIAPMFGGVISIIALMRIMIPKAYNSFINILVKDSSLTVLNKSTIAGIINSYIGLLKVIFSIKNFENPYFYIFLFAAICISAHISLSSADIRGASKGILIMFALIIILNIVGLTKYISVAGIIRYNIMLTGFLLVALIFSLITYAISKIFTLLIP
ncbi:hypothetical protein [Clostridium thailandense]|uniref:hypothetical protein n=1 Tax=Clostridium thailandense TaxID=2794346 RepID=UPI0039897610